MAANGLGLELDEFANDGGIPDAENKLVLSDPPTKLQNAIQRLDGVMRPKRRTFQAGGRLKRRETNNEYLCRLQGENPCVTDLVAEVSAWLGSS